MIKESRLQEILGRFSDSKILVIGDFYLDAYWMIDKTRSTLSLETPWHTSPVVDQHYSPTTGMPWRLVQFTWLV